MKPTKINSFERYLEIADRYGVKGCKSNDYIQREAADLISHNVLFECCGEKNAFLFVKKEGFYRVYYYLNDFEELLSINDEELVTEILYRGGGDAYPIDVVEYLQKCGFKKNLVRDLYELRFKNLGIPCPYPIPEDVVIRHACSLEEARFCVSLFNDLFDHYSGDYLSDEETKKLFENQQIYVAVFDKKLVGGLHVSKGGNNFYWMDHLAVTPEARGKHIATSLFMKYIQDVVENDTTRYSLWTQHQNTASIKMYEKIGFKYVGKSTLSMIKN